MDLWNVKNVKDKAKKLVESRGYKVKQVYELTTGLWISVKLMDNTIINVNENELS